MDLKQFFIISPILQRSLPLRVSPTARGFHFRVVQLTFIYIYFFVIFLLVSHLRNHGIIQGHEDFLLGFIVRLHSGPGLILYLCMVRGRDGTLHASI